MKRLYPQLLSLSVCFLIAISASAFEYKLDGITYNLSGGNAELISGSYYSGDLVIPASITYNGQTYSVTKIGNNAFNYGRITSVIIPNSVTTIGQYAFSSCSKMTTINIPESVTTIDDYAFIYCTNLTSIIIPGSVYSIGKQAFGGCSGLTSISFCNGLTTIGEHAFNSCTGLTEVTIPSSVTYIYKNAFNGCTNLTKVVIESKDLVSKDLSDKFSNIEIEKYPSSLLNSFGKQVTHYVLGDNITKIGNYAFNGCSDVKTIDFSDSVTSFGICAFYGCSSLESVRIPESMTNILEGTFWKCSSLTSITIPDSVTEIRNYAFSECSNLTSINIPQGITSLGYDAFLNCNKLSKVIIPDIASWVKLDLTDHINPLIIAHHLYSDAETEITDLIIPEGVTKIGAFAFSGCLGLKSIIFPESLTSIGYQAFSGCSGINNLYLSNGIKDISEDAFKSCWIKAVHISDLTAYCNITFQNLNSTPLMWNTILYLGDELIKDLVIPDDVSYLKSYTFANCRRLTSVTIPEGISSIGYYTFANCDSLKSVSLPQSLLSIGNGAFRFCGHVIDGSERWPVYGLETINLPSNLKYIGNEAFYGCYAIKDFHLPDNIVSIGEKAFHCQERMESNDYVDIVKIYANQGTETLISLWNAGYSPIDKTTNTVVNRPTLELEKVTQATVSAKIVNYQDNYQYCINGQPVNKSTYTLSKLRPGFSGALFMEVMNKNSSDDSPVYTSYSSDFTTEDLSPFIDGKATASSIYVKGDFTHGDAEILSQSLVVNGESHEGNTIHLTGLEPESDKYSIGYSVVVGYGEGETYTYNVPAQDFQTEPLTLTTSMPKVINAGDVIVAATSNLDDEEMNVGFEWRRIDWTDDFPSNSATAYLYEGTIQGYIRNMNTNYLWKFRPYYESTAGNRYYGDWMGIDPTNTSYFEPTVHTYSRMEIKGNTVNVKGSVMRGSDDVAQQGFLYWKQEESNEVKAASGGNTSIPIDAQKVEANGMVMEASLKGLDFESTYNVVAFVTTTEGEMFYGETHSFTTGEAPGGIEEILKGRLTDAPVIVAYYDLNGRRIAKAQRGVNLLHMSDGTTRKVVVK